MHAPPLVEPLLDEIADEEERDGLKPMPYAKNFLMICVKEVHAAIMEDRGIKLDIEMITESVQKCLMDNAVLGHIASKEGIKVGYSQAEDANKSPFNRMVRQKVMDALNNQKKRGTIVQTEDSTE